VLLVEDDPAVRSFVRRTLEDCGYTVLPASEPIEALRLAKKARVDVILSDMMMPNMTGAQFIERFLAEHPAPIVVCMSGFADDELMSDGRAISAAYLRKPFTPIELANAMRDAIDASKRTAAAL
jgi:CheY-like chemotaxis protein